MKLVKSFALIFFITVVVVSFQSCTIKQNTGLLGSSTSAQSAADAILDAAPFAFDYAADTISYNSCVGEGIDKTQIHGLKIGANEGFTDQNATGAVQGGAKLRSDFLQYIGKNISPIYPSTVITPAQVVEVLQSSSKNSDSFIQYAVRNKLDLSPVVDTINPSSAVVLNRDGVIEYNGLRTAGVITEITKNVLFGPGGAVLSEGQRISTVQVKTSIAQPLEAAFQYNASVDDTFPATAGADDGQGAGEQYADNIRKRFNLSTTDKILLTTTFGNPNATGTGTDSGLSAPKRPVATDKTKAYGRSYELKFESAGTKAGWRENRLTKITEASLGGDTLGIGTWTCQSFVIMKKSHWNNPKPTEAGCAPLSSADLQDAVFAAQIKKIRRHYSEANWSIGIYYGKSAIHIPVTRNTHTLCLVPKRDSECYLQTSGLTATGVDIGVQYDPGQECYLSRYLQMGVTYTGGLTGDSARLLGRCAQYASVCTRQ